MIKADLKFGISNSIVAGMIALSMILMSGLIAVPADGGDLYGHVYPSQTAQYNITSDSNTSSGSFALSWNDSRASLDLALVSPDRREINKTSADNSSIFYLEDASYRHLIMNDPAPGIWVAYVTPVNVPPEGADFCISADMIPETPQFIEANSSSDAVAKLSDRYSRREVGIDKSGLYGQLGVDVGIDVVRSGNYSVKGWLCDADGDRVLPSQDHRYLDAGAQKIRLNFSGQVIRARLIKDPMSLGELDLMDDLGRVIDHRDSAFSIRGVSYSDFKEPPVRFNGIYSDSGSDSANGKFTGLNVGVGIDAAKDGRYMVRGTLYDSSDRQIAIAGRSTFGAPLLAGPHDMVLYFDGPLINEMSANGPYELRDLGLYMGKGWSELIDYIPVAYTTSQYRYDEFRKRAARIDGVDDYGTDTNGDKLYDFMTVEAQVNVSNPGNYTLVGDLYSSGGAHLLWSMDQDYLSSGQSKMYLDFDGKALWNLNTKGPYVLENLTLYRENWTFIDAGDAYVTAPYNVSDFMDPISSEKVISGNGSGELLITIKTRDRVNAFHDRYSYDLVGINVPPISTAMKIGSSKWGYNLSMPGVFIPNKPNNFTVEARGVKSLNIGVKKEENAGRTWVTAQIPADENGVASMDNDLISPGRYQFKIFGEANNSTRWVDLYFTAVKKIIINGEFSLAINTSGLPSGNYSISAKALNGSFSLDDLQMDGLSFTA